MLISWEPNHLVCFCADWEDRGSGGSSSDLHICDISSTLCMSLIRPCTPPACCPHKQMHHTQAAGWEDRGLGGSSSDAQQAAQQLSEDLEAYGDPAELETLGE